MHLLLILFIYLALGVGAGFLSGLFGAGGGLVMVPGLLLLFQWESLDPGLAMHIAVGTSLAAMVPLALRSLISHIQHQVSFFSVYKKMAPGVFIGVIVGGVLAHFVRSRLLEIIFGLFVIVMGVMLLRQRHSTKQSSLPGFLGMSLAGGFVGIVSGMLGVAGSAFSVPFLTHRGVTMHTAVVVSVAIAMTVSVVGATTFYLTGMHVSGLPHWSLGYIYLPAWIGLAIGGICIAPLGAKISHRISAEKLKLCFALFLFVVAIKMLI